MSESDRQDELSDPGLWYMIRHVFGPAFVFAALVSLLLYGVTLL